VLGMLTRSWMGIRMQLTYKKLARGPNLIIAIITLAWLSELLLDL